VVTHADCLGCEFRGENIWGMGHHCHLWDGIKVPDKPCPTPKWRDEMLKSRRLKEGKRDPI
jgi:hypothetical protein